MARADNEPSLLLTFTRSPDKVSREARTQSWRVLFLLSAVMVSGASCASAPREAVELSHVAARRIADTQAAHEALASAYFSLTRQRIEAFVIDRWTPSFLATFVSDAKLMDELQNPVVLSEAQRERLTEELARQASLSGQTLDQAIRAVNSAFGDSERGQIVLEFSEAALEQIAAQRRELLAPIEAQEREVLQSLRANYAEMNQIQSVITAYLQSIEDVRAEEDAVLSRLNLLRARDTLVNRAISLNNSVLRLTDQAGDAEATLQQIRERLGLTSAREDRRP